MVAICPLENKDCQYVVPFAWQIGEYYIEIHRTIFGGNRVIIRELNPVYQHLANWCAGKEAIGLNTLLTLAKHCLENDIDFPVYSRRKPYFNDPEFMEFLSKQAIEPLPFF